MDIRRVFGANVRRYRLAAHLSQEAVAERMGVDRAHVSAIERGLQNATLLTILQAAQALNVQPAELLEENVPKAKS
ncbi:MAG: helix-turn-helix transcriptional regulator [Rhodospirillales bacterium]|nr:MAG: helix-turn-helix transcriptional regulator [Rhodospirillales bacterium]